MTVITIDAEVLEKEILESKVCTAYSTKNDSSQYVDYKSQGDTRLTINGSRHYKTPFGSLPSVTTILGATQGSKAALERWNKKNPGKKDFNHEENEDPEFIKDTIEPFWNGLPEKLDKFDKVIWAENPANNDFQWCIGGDDISRVWSPGNHETEVRGWAGAPDIIATYQGKVVLGDLKTSNGLYFGKWPGPDTPREEYGMRRAGFIKYQKCCMQLAAYDIAVQHTIGIKPDIHMIIVATVERPQVFAIQGRTIDKYKEKWMKCVDKYYEEFHNIPEIEMEVVDLDKLKG